MITKYIRRIVINDYRDNVETIKLLDRIGRGKLRYFKYSQYREIRTYDGKIHGFTRHMVYKVNTFKPDIYVEYIKAARARYIGGRAYPVVKNRLCVETCLSVKDQYARLRGISTVNVYRDENGQPVINYNHNII